MQTIFQDMRYACRMLFKNPGITTVAILTLAVGIGANSAIFSVVDVLVLRPLPFEEVDGVMTLAMSPEGVKDEREGVSVADFLDWRAQNSVFDRMSASMGTNFNITGIGDPEYVAGARVTADFFDILRVKAAHGRLFLPGEDEAGNDRVAVISHNLWQRRFKGDPAFVGTVMSLNGENTTVIGILPADHQYPVDQDLWTPLALTAEQRGDRTKRALSVMGRLKPSVTRQQATAEMNTIVGRLAQQYPDTNAGWNVIVLSLLEQFSDEITAAFSFTLLGAVAFVLLLACANVMNLQLARATGRQKEIAIRTALGANKWRVIRQLLIESALLSAIAGIFGILIAYWGIDMIHGFIPAEIARFVPMWNHMGIDARVLMFTTVIVLVTGLVSGLAPAIQAARPDLNETLTDSARGSSGGIRRRRLRSGLVVSEVALALVLLVGASLMIQGFLSLINKDYGFNPDNLLTMRITLPDTKYNEPHLITSFYNQAYERLGALPGVQSVGGGNFLHGDGSWDTVPVEVEGQPVLKASEYPRINRHIVSPGYLPTLQVPLMSGRMFTEADDAQAPPVIMVTESMARKYWPEKDPIGQRIKIGITPSVDGAVAVEGPWRTVVGVVKDATYFWFDAQPRATVYLPAQQAPRLWINVVLRTAGDPLSVMSAARREIAGLDPEQAVAEIRTMEKVLSDRLVGVRLGAVLMGVFSIIALVLAGVGIYSVMAYSVAQRTHEIGIRMAIGARRKAVLMMVMRHALTLTVIGLAIGLPVAFALSNLMMSGLGGATAFDLNTFIGFTLLLIVVSTGASLIPARRATRVDPMIALRYE